MLKRFGRMENIELLNETLKVMHDGFYYYNEEKKPLKLTRDEILESYVLLPEDIEKLKEDVSPLIKDETKKCKITVSTLDTYSAGIKMKKETGKDVLVLNFANPYSPGGGVRYGARAQEEDLCRKSSLLLSLENDSSKPYYDYNIDNENFMATDAVIITPKTEVIKDENNEYLENSVILSVITCPAPMLRNAPDDFDKDEYRKVFLNRIYAILFSAAKFNYRNLVLGAFGCGAFRNDPEIVAGLFKEAIKNFRYKDKDSDSLFDNIEFAILSSRVNPSRNYQEFSKVF